jgi:hypothetical protein
LLAALIAASIEKPRVNPREVHHFAHVAGQLAKTDESMLACWPSSPSVYALLQVRWPTPSASNSRGWPPAAASLLQMIAAERNRRSINRQNSDAALASRYGGLRQSPHQAHEETFAAADSLISYRL